MEQVCEAGVGAHRIKQLILADSEHNSDRLNGSGYEALATGIDLHPEAYVNHSHLAEAAAERDSGEPCW
jgi:hypothetical protein